MTREESGSRVHGASVGEENEILRLRAQDDKGNERVPRSAVAARGRFSGRLWSARTRHTYVVLGRDCLPHGCRRHFECQVNKKSLSLRTERGILMRVHREQRRRPFLRYSSSSRRPTPAATGVSAAASPPSKASRPESSGEPALILLRISSRTSGLCFRNSFAFSRP